MSQNWRRAFPRFLIVFITIALPLVAIAHLELRVVNRSNRTSIARRGIAAARLGATAVDEYLLGCAVYLEAYARNPSLVEGVERHDSARVSSVLAELAQHNRRVDRTFVTDPAGVEWCDYPHDPAVMGHSFAFRDWFTGVTRTESTYVSSVYRRAAANRERTIAIATPVRMADGRVGGYIIAHALVTSLEKRLAQTPVSRFGDILTLDRNDAVVTGADSSQAASIRDSLAVALLRARRGEPVQWTSLDQRPYVAAYAEAPALGGSVVALRDLKGTVAAEHAMARTVYTLAIALSLLLAIILDAILERRARRARETADARLRESERRFRATFEQAAVGIAHFDAGGRMLRVNQKLCDILGYSQEELLARDLSQVIRLRKPDEPDGLAFQDLTQLETWRNGTYRAEQELLRRDGLPVWCQVTVAPVLGEAAGPDYFAGVVEDISERKHLEEQFLQSQKLRAIGQLAGGIAHDFNNLLTTILGYCELLERRLPRGESGRVYVDEISRAGQRASSLTAQLLAFSRKQILKPRPLHLNEVVGGIDQLLRRLIGQHMALDTRLHPALGAVRADPVQIEQVLMNLVMNARDAMPRGGQITIETCNAIVPEPPTGDGDSSLPAGEYVTVSVSDTGVGMDEATIAQIFEPFFTTKEIGKGTGLGLSTVYGIVKQSGGAIVVSSALGKGTTFRVYLPRTETAPAPVPGESEMPGVAESSHAGSLDDAELRGDETVLLVEDDDTLRGLTKSVLADAGYTVVEASSGSEALDACDAHQGPIHVLVTDITMPGMSGAALTHRVRETHSEMKVIYTSGFVDEASQGALDPAISFLQKPYTPGSLLETIRRVLDQPTTVA